MRRGLLFGLALAGLGTAQAGVLWDNGAINATTPRFCDSSPLQCGGNTNTDNGSEHSTKSAMMCAKNCANVETHSSTDNPE